MRSHLILPRYAYNSITTITNIIRIEEKKRRRALTDADRFIIRKRNQTHPPAQQKDLANWFTATTGHPLDQSQISRILGPKFDYLDSKHTQKDIREIKRKSRSSIGD